MRPLVALVGVTLVAAVVRLVAQLHAADLPFLDKYPQAARLLAAGDSTLTGERILDFSPLYLILSWAFETAGLPVRAALGWLQAAAGVAAVLLAVYLGRRLGGPVAGLAAGALLALDRMAVVAGTVLEPEIFLAVLLLAGTALVLPVDDRRREVLRAVAAGLCFGFAALARPNALLVPTLLIGLALTADTRVGRYLSDLLFRPLARQGPEPLHTDRPFPQRILIAVPILALLAVGFVDHRLGLIASVGVGLFALLLALRHRHGLLLLRPPVRSGPALLAAGTALATAATGLALWLGALHHLPAAQWPALMSPGQVFHQGNGPAATGFGLSYPPSVRFATEHLDDDSPDFEHQAYRLVARAEAERCLTATEAEGAWRGLALAAMAERPGWAVERTLTRLGGSLSRHQVWDVAGAPEMESRLALWTPVGLFLLLPLSLAAFLPLRTRRETEVPWVVLPGLAVALVTAVVFFVSGRHRLLLDVFLTVSAGVGAAALWRFFAAAPTERRLRPWLVGLLLVVVGALPLLTPDPVTRGRRFIALDQTAARLVREARGADRDGDRESARQAATRALVLSVEAARDLPPELLRDPRVRQESRRLAAELVRLGDDPEASRGATALADLGGCGELARALVERAEPLGAGGAAAYVHLVLCHQRGAAAAEAGRLALDHLRDLDAPPLLAWAVIEMADPSAPIPDTFDPLSAAVARAQVHRAAGRTAEADGGEHEILARLRAAASCPTP